MDDQTFRMLEESGYPFRRAVGWHELKGKSLWIIDSSVALEFTDDYWEVFLYPDRKMIPGEYWFDYMDACRLHCLAQDNTHLTERGMTCEGDMESFIRWFCLLHHPAPSSLRMLFDDAHTIVETMRYNTCISRCSILPDPIDLASWKLGLRSVYGPVLADERSFLEPVRNGVTSWVIPNMKNVIDEKQVSVIEEHPRMGFDDDAAFSLPTDPHRVNEVQSALSMLLSTGYKQMWEYTDPAVSRSEYSPDLWKKSWDPEKFRLPPPFARGVFR